MQKSIFIYGLYRNTPRTSIQCNSAINIASYRLPASKAYRVYLYIQAIGLLLSQVTMQILTKLSLVALCLIALFAVLCLLQKNKDDNTTNKQSLRRSLLGTIIHPMQQQQGGLIDPQSIVYKPPPTMPPHIQEKVVLYC